VAIGVGAGLLWRLEIEYHGWAGLDWIGYYHWAVPISVTAFILWALRYCEIEPRARLVKFAIVLLLLAVVLGSATQIILWDYFILGPRAILFGRREFGPSIFVLYPLVPLIVWFVSKLFGQRGSLVRGLLSLSVFLAAFPLALLLLSITGAREVDAIHTIKSGFIVPWLVIGLGVLFVPSGRRSQSHS
jgi:hypothetical protein